MKNVNPTTDFSDDKFDILLHQYFSGEMGDDDAVLLKNYLSQSRYIQRFVQLCKQEQIIYDIITSDSYQSENTISFIESDILQEFAKYEETAPAIEIPTEKQQHNKLIRGYIYPPAEKRKISKFTIFSFIISAAAIFFVILFVRFAPEKQYCIDVATLLDQMNVEWADPTLEFKNGERLWTNKGPLQLSKGVVKILYDNDVEVFIEGPAVFEIERSEVYLEYGRLFSHVSNSGLGFTVRTPTSQFVDHGTEFGVLAELDGSAELHVIKGKVQLFAALKDNTKTSQIIEEDQAIRYDANNGNLRKISIESSVFVRQFNSQSGMIWRGQESLDLADIVGGGNGFGTGQLNCVVEANTGRSKVLSPRELKFKARKGDSKYHIVNDIRYIDGIFVPDGVSQINSQGYVYSNFPETSGLYSCDLLFGTLTEFSRAFVLDGIGYGTRKHPSIFMHANLGATFDLQAIRNDLKEVRISEFRAKAGISESANGLKWANVDIWIFLDDQLAYDNQGVTSAQIENIKVTIPEGVRFLTLVVTEGLPERPEIYDNNRKVIATSIYSDWLVWANPLLVLE